MKISDIYGKKVESTAGKRGYVFSVRVNGNKIASLICADGNEKEFAVDVDNIISEGETIVFEDRESQTENGAPLRLGMPVFDIEGNFLGKLTDFTAEKHSLRFAHVGRKKFAVDDIVCGDAVIVKNMTPVLKSDVKKSGRVIIKRGTPLTNDVLLKASEEGEYVQAKLKSI